MADNFLLRIRIITSPNKWRIPWSLKIQLGCISKKLVVRDGEIIKIRGIPLCYHDLYHLEVSQLERIQIGKYLVSGIHGINSPVFHKEPIIEEYDGILDEIRVAFHELLVQTSIYNTIKAIAWFYWLICQGINPVETISRHYKTLQANELFLISRDRLLNSTLNNIEDY